VTCGDAALEKKALPYLLTDAETEEAACEVLLGLVVDRPSHVRTKDAAYPASATTCGGHVKLRMAAVQRVWLRDKKNRVSSRADTVPVDS